MARTAGSIGTETAKRVLREALSLFASDGYAAVSMRQIAGACGLQAGALYNHFPTKQAILRDLMIAHMQELLNAFVSEDMPEDPVAALEAFVRFHIRYHIDKPEEVFIAYMELRNLEPEAYTEVMQYRQQYERALRSILREGQSEGRFVMDDIPVTAMSIISMLRGVNTWYRYDGRLSVKQVEQIYVNMVLAVVGLGHTASKQLEEKV